MEEMRIKKSLRHTKNNKMAEVLSYQLQSQMQIIGIKLT